MFGTNDQESSDSEKNDNLIDNIHVPLSSIKVFKGHVPATPVPRTYNVDENVGTLRNMDLDNFMARYP